jgi:DNA-binding NtrC family response regulator
MPRKRSSLDDETLRVSPDGAAPRHDELAEVATRFVLLVYHQDGVQVVPLREGVPVTVGRSAPSECVIDDRSLSRSHARFTLEDGAVTVEDLGSTNGTLHDGERVERAVVRPGDIVTLGNALAAVHAPPVTEAPREGFVGHDALLGALAREIKCARYFQEPFSLVMVAAADGAHVASWSERLLASLRPVDLCALYGPNVLEILLPRTSAEGAVAWGRGLDGRLRVGIASFPVCATSSEELVEGCAAALKRTTDDEGVLLAPGYEATVTEATDEPVVASEAMREVFELVDRVAGSTITVLVVGETGVGKEVVARAIHERGPRNTGQLVCVNCGAIPGQLVESTLFGHERGAFTGAAKATPGMVRTAEGGTLLLDEIGELPPSAQASLLRVLETKRVTPVGGTGEHVVDVRVIAATHCDLEEMCDRGEFRRDLLYRLNAITVEIPPLRRRREEIAALCGRFLQEAMVTHGREMEGIDAGALKLLEEYAWPGNVRELKNVIERAVVIARGEAITVDDLPQRVRAKSRQLDDARPELEADADEDLKTRVRRYEARVIEAALEASGGNQTEAARALRVPLRTLVHKITTLGLRR